MKPCECGCGQPVKYRYARYVIGHHNKSHRRKKPLVRDFLIAMQGVDGCWIFPGRPSAFGYKPICENGIQGNAHRKAYEIAIGPPGKLDVLHRCDNPPCCNPSHLFLGTQADNVRDCCEKKRFSTGAPHVTNAKLSERDIPLILSSKGTDRALADYFNVGIGTIRNVRQGKTWRHLKAKNGTE